MNELLPLVISLVLEFILRRFPSQRRLSVFLLVQKSIAAVRMSLELAESGLGIFEKKMDLVVPQKLKEPK